MAVESRHLFSPQFLGNRQMINSNGSISPMAYGMPPLPGATNDALLPMYDSSGINHSVQGLPVSRKRSRDSSINHFQPCQNMNPSLSNSYPCGTFTFLGEDISLQIHQQQMEIDRFIAQHTAKVRMEIENRNSRRIMAAVEEGIIKRLRGKEEEIGKLNWALEEKVKSLSVENQVWRELAQTNEATANALRTNLEQVIAQVQDDKRGAIIDDAESCCGSNYDLNVQERINNISGSLDCRNCRKKESACYCLLPGISAPAHFSLPHE